MIIVLERGASEAQAEEVLGELERLGLRGRRIGALDDPLIHVVEGRSRRARTLQDMDVVEGLVPTPGPRIRSRGRYFFPYHMINWISLVLVVLGILVALAGFFPPGVGEDIDRLGVAPAISLPWYLRAPHAFVTHGLSGSLVLALGCVLFFFLPKLDRSSAETLASRLVVVLAGILFLAAWVFLSI
jgi:quinol-cytochrome oxidoreductase complex cytochrome b subunit